MNSYKQKQSSFEAIDSELKEMQTVLDSMQDKRWDLQQKLSDKKSLFDRTNTIIQEKTDNISLVEEKILSLEKEFQSIAKQIEIKKNTKYKYYGKIREKIRVGYKKRRHELEELQYEKQQIDIRGTQSICVDQIP